MKKRIKSKLFDYTCPQCGWKTSRGTRLFSPACSLCGSEEPPIITEREIVKEVEINQTYTSSDYSEIKRITREIEEGKALEEIEGLGLGDSLDVNPESHFCLRSRKMIVPSIVKRSKMICGRMDEVLDVFRKTSDGDCSCKKFEEPVAEEDPKHDYY
jgi:hypothetical protein